MADKPVCKYGKKCYRKNAAHLEKFSHNDRENIQDEGNTSASLEPPIKKRRKDEKQPETTSKCSKEEVSDKISHEIIKEKFGISMPQDFYDLWLLCKELNPQKPQDALKDVSLELVGPYDILSGKEFQTTENSCSLCLHYRYFCDPPEFVTVLKGDDTVGLHIGYYRDNPDDKPVLVASNESKTNCEFRVLGDNIFAGISNSLKHTTKNKGTTESRMLKEKIEKNARERKLNLEPNPPSIKARNKKVVAKTFHKMGIVVPLDENGVGYRDLQISNGELKRMLADIVNDNQREAFLDELQDIITRVQFANDECDYGMGLELGLDLFSFGHEMFNRKATLLLTLAYELLGRSAFGKVVERHLEQRDKNSLYINLLH
ncbi:histone PARylation factor 1-like [Dendronephthya gigantea]|uniref:histone PARylation factor 1-like n=1 Tax=Dendronephthya gigantea TaxID=151771 RepID=UPI00106C1102|nr:histone PARylation factor 1-like [Dendronephthya gigantea]